MLCKLIKITLGLFLAFAVCCTIRSLYMVTDFKVNWHIQSHLISSGWINRNSVYLVIACVMNENPMPSYNSAMKAYNAIPNNSFCSLPLSVILYAQKLL